MNAFVFLLAAVVAVSFTKAEDDYIVCSDSLYQNDVYVLENAVYKCVNGQESLEYCVICDNSNGQSFSANFVDRYELQSFRDAPAYASKSELANFCNNDLKRLTCQQIGNEQAGGRLVFPANRNFCDITNGGGTVYRAANKDVSEVPLQQCQQQQQNWGWGYGRR